MTENTRSRRDGPSDLGRSLDGRPPCQRDVARRTGVRSCIPADPRHPSDADAEAIRVLAHRKWEAAGCPSGRRDRLLAGGRAASPCGAVDIKLRSRMTIQLPVTKTPARQTLLTVCHSQGERNCH